MKCPDCDGKIKIGLTNCLDCGRSLADLDLEQISREFLAKRKKMLALVMGGVLILTGGVIAKTYVDNQQEKKIAQERAERAAEALKLALEAEKAEQERIEQEKKDYSWVPDGFTKFSQNYNVSYKQISYDAADCYQERCFGMVVVSRDYCSTLSIEANFVRKSDQALVDRDSDFAYNVASGQKVIMKLGTEQEAPNSVIFTEVRCS